jgi:hypothetical protein
VNVCGGGTDGFEAEAMEESGAVLLKGATVVWGGIAFVGREIVLRKDFVPGGEAGVTVNFGEDGRGGDGSAPGVTVDES